MLKKTIKFKDFNEEDREEDFYFNLTEAELLEMETSTAGGYTTMVRKIVATKDTPAIMEIFKQLITKAYGEKSADGRRFIKNPILVEEFTQTNAYSQLYVELATDSEAASAFINGILPKSLQERIAEEGAKPALPSAT